MRSRGVFVGALSALLCLLCMCSSESPLPPVYGDCEAGCAVAPSGGSSTPPSGTAVDSGAGTTGDASSCGLADSHVMTGAALCVPCVIANCCSEDTACTDTCISLLDCTQGCAAGDTLCVGSCENTWQAGMVPYQAFTQCLQQSCTNMCPALQE